MANKLVRPVTKQYIAGTPSIPPKPERCYTVPVNRLGSGTVGSSSTTFIPLDEVEFGGQYSGFLQPVYRPVPAYVDENGNVVTQELIGYNALRFSPDPVSQPTYTSPTKTVCEPGTPGVPGTPAQIIEQNAGPDWQASARSIATVSGNVVAEFSVNPSPRLMIGFGTKDTGANQNDLRMGVAFISAGLTTQMVPIIDGAQGSPIGTYTAGTRISLWRINGVFYIKHGEEQVYETAATTESDVFLDAMLYTSTDYVDDPVLGTSADPDLTVSSPVTEQGSVAGSVGYDGYAGSVVDGEVSVPVAGALGFSTAVSSAGLNPVAIGFIGAIRSGAVNPDGAVGDSDITSAAITIGGLTVTAADRTYISGQTTLPKLVVDADGGQISQTVDGGDQVLAPLVTYGAMQTGGLIQGDVTLKSLAVFAADRAYAEGQAMLPRLRVYGDDGFGIPNYYGHNEVVKVRDSFATDPSLFASIYETLDLEAEMSLATLVSGDVFDGLILDPSLTAKDFLVALIESGINLSSATQMPDPAVAQYAFNALTGAATRYSNFGFSQFARVGGTTYAVKKDGLYRLRPGDDNGERRSAMVDFGEMSFGVNQKKHIETMYLGMSTDGTVYAKLTADGGPDKVYRVIQREPTMRVLTGKGVTAREWGLKLEVVDATRVDLDNVEFIVGASVRRWTR